MPDLDDAYANGPYIPDAASYPSRWAAEAAAFRAALGDRAELDLFHGPSERMAYDLFWPEAAAQGLMIFVHGGYWLKFDRKTWSHFAGGAVARGWAVAMPSYDLAPSVSIAMITQQIALAVTQAAARVDGPVTLTGHSAGGHLVSRMLAPGVLRGDILERVAHVVPISPVADLEPLLRTSMNTEFRMDTAMAQAESPVRQPKPDVPVIVRVGTAERPVFVEQAQLLAERWEAPMDLVPKHHHFDIIDALKDPASSLVKTLTTGP